MSTNLRLKFYESNSDKVHETSDSQSKRNKRTRKTPKRFSDFLNLSPSKRQIQKLSSSDDEFGNEQNDELTPEKPTALFSNDDVEGQDIFKFKLHHTKYDLKKKAQSAMSSSPKLTDSPLKTPKKLPFNNLINTASEVTPKHVKDVIKKRIVQEVESEDDGVSDFSNSSSDFVPDKSDNESDSSSSSTSLEEEIKAQTKPTGDSSVASKLSNRSKPKDSEYYVAPDNYFMMNSGKKITTSDHTLARLKNLSTESSETSGYHLSNEHRNKITELNNSYHHLFDRWLYALSQNFNIILYGIGSKRTILQHFQTEKLKRVPCIVVNGFFPSLSIKNILDTIVIGLLENTQVPSNVSEVITLINKQLIENDLDLFLIIHNIDGVMLRNSKVQATIASLSQVKNIHLIATIDHINAPLLWDHSKLSKFNFTWWDVTTFMPYTEETSYENSIMAQQSGALQLSSLRSVYQSLTSNARGIFKIIIEFQLEKKKQTNYQGLPFKELYSKCREQFLVSSDLVLRAQLTEFLDHKLVKMKRTYDGSENLVIPIDNSLLQQFLEQQES